MEIKPKLTKAQAILLAELTGYKMIVHYHNEGYCLVRHSPNVEKLIKFTGSFIYKTQAEENRILVYDEGNRHVREETIGPDGRLISRRSYVKPKVQVVERTGKKPAFPVRTSRQNHRSGSF